MKITVRNFLYLDSELTDQFLAQLQDGIYHEEQQRESEIHAREVSGGANVRAIHGGGKRAGLDEIERSRVLRQTPESAVNRLISVLEKAGGVQYLDAFDDAIWDQLEQGEVIDIRGLIEPTALTKMGDIAQAAMPMLEMANLLGLDGVDPETQEAFAGIKALTESSGRLPVVVRPLGARRFKFIAQLGRVHVRLPLNQLEGEAHLLATLQRKLAPSERHTIMDEIPAFASLPRAERRKMAKGAPKDLPNSIITPPAALVTPVAVWR